MLSYANSPITIMHLIYHDSSMYAQNSPKHYQALVEICS